MRIMTMLIVWFLGMPWNLSAQNSEGPLNASVSNFGTSFTFGPSTICKGCVQTELGTLSIERSHTISSMITVAPFTRTDVSISSNLLESTSSNGKRQSALGKRVDVIIRQSVPAGKSIAFTIAPRFASADGASGIGGSLVAQYVKNQIVTVFNATAIQSPSESAYIPRLDEQLALNVSRMLGSRGASVFTGAYARNADDSETVGLEGGFVYPFRNGQLEFATEYLNTAGVTSWQYQMRVTKNWGKWF